MNKQFKAIEDKIYSGGRIDEADALFLFGSSDIVGLGRLADLRRKQIAGDDVFYSFNLNVNPTNVCELRCDLCAFSKDEGEPGSYERSIAEIVGSVKKLAGRDAGSLFEVHIVGGLSPKLTLAYYEELLERIKNIRHGISIQAFTAVEIDYLAKNARLTIDETLKKLKKAGLDTIPGGGAEIFSDRVRKVICKDKISGEDWLSVMNAAHNAGIPTNATMLYGHIETDEERVDHLSRLRALQDRTGGFKCFVPLSFYEGNTKVRRTRVNTGYDDLKVIAVGRLFLDNFTGVKALYTTLGIKFAQIALSFGANDLGGTSIDERIVRAAGAAGPCEGVSEKDLIRIIEGAGRAAVRTESTYSKKIRRSAR